MNERERIESLTERHAAFQAINFCNSFCVDMDCLLNRRESLSKHVKSKRKQWRESNCFICVNTNKLKRPNKRVKRNAHRLLASIEMD